MAFRSDDISINTLVGSGSFVKGDMKVNGFISPFTVILTETLKQTELLLLARRRVSAEILRQNP